MSSIRRLLPSSLALLLGLIVLACAPTDPQLQRRGYKVELNGWAAKETGPPPMVEEVQIEGEGAEEAAAEPAEDAVVEPGLEGSEALEPAPPATVEANVQLSVLVTNDSGDLDQLTLDISHADENGVEIETYRRTVDVSQIVRGLTSEITVSIDAIQLGAKRDNGTWPDQFAVSIRPEVPASERGDYPEFAGGA